MEPGVETEDRTFGEIDRPRIAVVNLWRAFSLTENLKAEISDSFDLTLHFEY